MVLATIRARTAKITTMWGKCFLYCRIQMEAGSVSVRFATPYSIAVRRRPITLNHFVFRQRSKFRTDYQICFQHELRTDSR